MTELTVDARQLHAHAKDSFTVLHNVRHGKASGTFSIRSANAIGIDSAMRHLYEVRPRRDHRGVDLISDALPFGQ